MNEMTWLKEISPIASSVYDVYKDVNAYGKSNPYIIDVKSDPRGFTIGNTHQPLPPINIAPLNSNNTINLFGANARRFMANYGNPAWITIEYLYKNYSYGEFIANTMQNPFEIGVMRLEVVNANQFLTQNYKMNVTSVDPTGKTKSQAIPIWRKLNQFTADAIEIDLTEDKIIIDGDTQIGLNIVGYNSLRIYFYPSLRASFKMLMSDGYLAKKFDVQRVPLIPNRTVADAPIEMKLTDRKYIV